MLVLHALAALLGFPSPAPVESQETFEVYFVEAPLFKYSFPGSPAVDITIAAQAFHAGVAIRAPNGTARAYEYDAASGIVAGVVPVVNSTGSLVWNNIGMINEERKFNASYWTRASLQARTTEQQTEHLVQWFRAYNRSAPSGSIGVWAPDYSPFDVLSPNGSLLLRSQTCQDFVFDAVAELKSMGVAVLPLVPNRKSRGMLFTAHPLKVVADDDAELLAYWSAVSELLRHRPSAHSIVAAFELLDTIVLQRHKTVFVRGSDGRNLRVELTSPYAKWAYEALDDRRPSGPVVSWNVTR